MKSKAIIEKSTAKEKLEKAKMAEIKRQMLEGELIKRKDVVSLMKKLEAVRCGACAAAIQTILKNLEEYSLHK